MFILSNQTIDIKRNFIASFSQWFPCGTNETASLIIHDYGVSLAQWPTVHNAASGVMYRGITDDAAGVRNPFF